MAPNQTKDPSENVTELDEAERLEKLLGDGQELPFIETKSFRATVPQVLATWAQSLLLLSLGMMINTPTVVVGALLHNTKENELTFSERQAAWFSGILLIMEPIGALFSGFLQDKLGRKKCMAIVNIPQFFGWLLLYWANSTNMLFFASFCLGLSIGFMEAPVLSYVGEVTQPRLRGSLAIFTSLHVTIGLLVMFLLGHATDWRSAALITSALPIICIIAIMSVPESPVWLLMKDRKEDSMKALCWLRGWVEPKAIMPEFRSLERHVQASILDDKGRGGIFDRLKDNLRPEMRGAFKLVLTFFFFAHCGGLSATRPYLIPISKKLEIPLDPYFVNVIGGVLHMIGCLICMLTLRIVGKRFLSLVSLSGCVFIDFSLATYNYFQTHHDVSITWIPTVLILSLFMFTSLGIFVVPWALVSEVFPARGRGFGGGMTAGIYYLMFFTCITTFFPLEHALNFYGVLYMYGSIGFVGIGFIYFYLPETEGKPLEEVEQFFKKKDKALPT